MKIPVSHGSLEAILNRPDEDPVGKALLCHPHPQYGGSMHTKGLYYTAKILNELGFITMRFNFRGVGASTGSFDDGDGERDDILQVLDYFEEHWETNTTILGGFSFGAVVGLAVGVDHPLISRLIGLGLPLNLSSFDYLKTTKKPTLLIQGENDQFGEASKIKNELCSENNFITLKIIEDSGHLFSKKFEELQMAIDQYFPEE